jgi:hypothetical protein
MKLFNKKTLTPVLLAIVIVAGSCKKSFLDKPPLSEITTDNFYKSTSDLRLATAALYAQPWFDYNYFPWLGIGDVMAGNIIQPYNSGLVELTSFSISSGNEYTTNTWRCFYKIVAHCNVNIKAINTKAADSISTKNKNAALGELRFFRGMVYLNLAQLWGAVPIIEDNDALITNPLLPRHKIADVYKFVISDLKFAAQYLPASDVAGRVTTWSAQGLLAKAYLTRAGLGQSGSRNQADLDSAKYYAGSVCNNSGLSLLPSYYNLFKTQFNDNPESLFAFQWSPGVGYGNGNAIQAQFAPSGDLVTGGGGWGGAIGPTVDLYNLYTLQDSIRRKATFMLRGDYYPELNASGGGFRENGDANIKKHVVGTAADNNASTMDLWSSTEHNAVLRLADVYLIYAEAILGNSASTTDAEALKFFNKIRTRAGVDVVTSIDATALINERRVELAFEGQYWYDLVRLSYYNPAKAISLLNNQKRQQFTYTNGVMTPKPLGINITPASISTFTLPLPATEVTADPKLLEPPVAYY